MKYLPCPCGSGYDYLICCFCLDKTSLSDNLLTSINTARRELQKEFRWDGAGGGILKKCMYPSCGENAIRSHSISKSSYLRRIEGEPKKFEQKDFFELSKCSTYGVKEVDARARTSTVRYLFCKKHDNILFEDVDNCILQKSQGKEKILLLSSYRALCYKIDELTYEILRITSDEEHRVNLLEVISPIPNRASGEYLRGSFNNQIEHLQKTKIRYIDSIVNQMIVLLQLKEYIEGIITISPLEDLVVDLSEKSNPFTHHFSVVCTRPPFLISSPVPLFQRKLGGIFVPAFLNSTIVRTEAGLEYSYVYSFIDVRKLNLLDVFLPGETYLNIVGGFLSLLQEYFETREEAIERLITSYAFFHPSNLVFSGSWFGSLDKKTRKYLRMAAGHNLIPSIPSIPNIPSVEIYNNLPRKGYKWKATDVYVMEHLPEKK